MTHEQTMVCFGLVAMAACGALLVIHASDKPRPAKGIPPDGTVPNVSPAYGGIPSFLKYNVPPFGALPMQFIPNATSDDTRTTLYGGPYLPRQGE